MKKNNLLKRNPKIKEYVKKSSERDVYEQETFCRLTVKDEVDAIEDENIDINRMYKAFKDFRLKDFVSESFDYSKYNIKVTISSAGRNKIAKVKITKRTFLQKIKSCFNNKELP